MAENGMSRRKQADAPCRREGERGGRGKEWEREGQHEGEEEEGGVVIMCSEGRERREGEEGGKKEGGRVKGWVDVEGGRVKGWVHVKEEGRKGGREGWREGERDGGREGWREGERRMVGKVEEKV